MASFQWPPLGLNSTNAVTSLNAEVGDILLVAGSGISITPAGQNITIASTGSVSFPLLAPNGSAATPEYSFSNFPNYGLWASSTQIHLSVAGVDQFILDSGTPNRMFVGGTTAASEAQICRQVNDGTLTLCGQTSSAAGAYISLLGNTNATPGLIKFFSGGALSATANASQNWVFVGTIAASNFSGTSSGTNTGDVSLTAVGSTPSANGASLAGQALTLQPCDGSNPGLITTGVQTIAGAKQFSANMGIGVAAQTNRVLTINPSGATTGVSQYGCFLDYITDNTATSTAYGFYGVVRTPASAFTCNLAASVVADQPVAGAGSTISHFVNFKCFESTVGTNNAILVDGSTFTGNYAIKLVSVNPSQLAGQISAGGGTAASSGIISVTPAAANNVLATTDQRAFRATMVATTAATNSAVGYSSAPQTAAASAFRAYYSADTTSIGAGTATRDINYYMNGVTAGGTNNAGLSDNILFSGSWGINLVSTNGNLLSGPTAIGGTATNNNAAAGFVGEYIESVISSTTSIPGTTGQYGNLTSVALTAGDWEMNGLMSLDNANGASITTFAGAISINSGNTTTDQIDGSNQADSATPGAAAVRSISIPGYRLSLSAPTTVYLKMAVTFTVATPQYRCRLSARRMR